MSLPRLRMAIVLLAASAVATVGVVRLAAPDASSAAAAQVVVDGLTARITAAKWAGMDHDMSGDAPGYQMPPAMMPGMPAHGDQRLAVSVTVVNTGDGTRPMRPGEEFALHAGRSGGRWAPHSDTFGELPRLAPGNAVQGVLFFDLPPAEVVDSPVWVEWTHGGAANRLAVPMDGVSDGPSHPHTP
ncbi:hypothetical protein [Saccharothrix stipae]